MNDLERINQIEIEHVRLEGRHNGLEQLLTEKLETQNKTQEAIQITLNSIDGTLKETAKEGRANKVEADKRAIAVDNRIEFVWKSHMQLDHNIKVDQADQNERINDLDKRTGILEKSRQWLRGGWAVFLYILSGCIGLIYVILAIREAL